MDWEVAEARKKRKRRQKKSKKARIRRECPPCQKRKGKARRCKPVASGVSCGECLACNKGRCEAVSDGVTCPEPGPVPDCYTTVPEVYWQTDVSALIAMGSTADFDAKRQQIIDHIWKGAGLPPAQDVLITPEVASPIPGVANLASVDELAITVEDLVSHVFWFHPEEANGRLALYHAGHSETLGEAGGDGAIQMLVERGFTVLGFFMPGFGPNTRLPGPEPRHNVSAAQETATFSPLVYFLSPIPVALNTVLAQQAFADITMLGISGGGWATTLYAAIDPRIVLSFPIAGSYPAFLREAPCSTVSERGDWEQSQADLYRRIDYTQLYVLGAAGPGRRQFQILNQYDACCFSGLRYQVYEGAVASTVASAGLGHFAVWLDDSTRNEHVISAWARNRIAEVLG
ncbi:MAG: hypothetical protein KC442_11855 [Thermomicrobiales bacterium]|nr:hypothetical protein [Thermomicrobiales bacterium]